MQIGGSIEIIVPAFKQPWSFSVWVTPPQRGLVKEIGAFFLFMLQTVVSLELIRRHKQIIFFLLYFFFLGSPLPGPKQSAVVKDILLALILSSFLCVCSSKPAAS